MNENKTTTYGDLRRRKAELRDEMDWGDLTRLDEYRQTTQAIKDAELMLLYSITPDESCGELAEQIKPKTYKRVKYAFIAISIAVVVMIVLSGCQTFKGATGDTAWMFQKLSDNVQVEK